MCRHLRGGQVSTTLSTISRKKVSSLLSVELEKHHLSIMTTEFGRGLVGQKAYREGDVICERSLLLYSTIQKLQEMLSLGGYKLLVDRLLRIDGLLGSEGSAEHTALYGAFVGAAG